MRDRAGAIIYVGKAKLLPRRVSSYFRESPATPRVGLMVSLIRDFECLLTATEKEALILESGLIKKHRPRFNVILRDDKSYPSLRLSLSEEYPRLEVVRRPVKEDGSLIYGPFPSATALRETLKTVNRLFPLRRCPRPDVKKTVRPCLNYQLGLCLGPCRPEVTPQDYRQITDGVRLFFRGQTAELVRSLNQEMKERADRYEFEAAALLRDRLHDLEKTLERQVVQNFGDEDLDAWALCQNGGFTGGAVLLIRGGAVTGCRPLFMDGSNLSEGQESPLASQLLLSLLHQYYGGGGVSPHEIILPALPPPEDLCLLREILPPRDGKAVKILSPKRGDKQKLLVMARENAEAILTERLERLAQTQGVMAEIKNRLRLPTLPRRVECLDLAHLRGEAAVGGIVVMVEGDFQKGQFRRFKIKEAAGGDDYEGTREVIRRRFSPDKDPAKWPRPDLLLLDGGRGQIASALKAFKDLGLEPPPIAGIAKDRANRGPDRIFLPGRANPADLKPGSAGLFFLAKIRDEAHRYCRSYHHQLRSKDMLLSVLSGVKGLGPQRLKALSLAFPTLEDLSRAGDEAILKIAPLSPESLAEARAKLQAHLSDPGPQAEGAGRADLKSP
jgi:excinuclease ABC subunit C